MDTGNPVSVTLIGEAASFVAMLEHVSKAAPLAKPVLVIGERGTGKELIASRLHYLSERWEQPLVKVNCAALTESLLESELFGHEVGAFTGATRAHTGRFEQADGGTLVLDELGTIPLRMQENILRVIEYGEFQRVGGSNTLSTDVRVVGATNEDLPRLVQAGRFRADLLDRLAFDVIHVPPLRERPEDIPTLAYHFAVNITSELKRTVFSGFSPQAEAALVGYDWPGNVRELKNAVERSVYRAEDPSQPIADILFDPFASPFAPPETHAENPDAGPVEQSAGAVSPVPIPDDFRAAVDDFERQILEGALRRAQYRQTTAARMLGLSYHQLRGLLKKHGLPKTNRAASQAATGARESSH
ncbi:phage shock protein operon transcriptional activator [Candidatus Rariloculus sp.]|uniref:phage shock protein operon transcriptional activator n=1 Tax=Candidatus Rariloculus sp. TaxID=3101265 RepID=UPI003D0F78CF